MRVPRPTIENKGVLGFLVWGELDNAQRDVRTAYFHYLFAIPWTVRLCLSNWSRAGNWTAVHIAHA